MSTTRAIERYWVELPHGPTVFERVVVGDAGIVARCYDGEWAKKIAKALNAVANAEELMRRAAEVAP